MGKCPEAQSDLWTLLPAIHDTCNGAKIPPAPRCGDSDEDSHVWVSGWYPAAPELTILRKGLQTRKILSVFEMFEKTGCLFKVTRSYFLSCRHSLTPDPPYTLPLTPIPQYLHLPLCTNRAWAQGRAPNLLPLPSLSPPEDIGV